jgi:Tol biopolymer transport system component
MTTQRRKTVNLMLIMLATLSCSGLGWAVGDTRRVSVISAGAQGNGESYCFLSCLSADGRFVAFNSTESNLVVGDTNATSDTFIYDRLSHQTTRVCVDSAGNQGNGDSRSPSLSADGRFVAFMSASTNLVTGDTNGAWDIFVHDRLTHHTTRVSVDSDGVQANGYSHYSSLSSDGRFVAFDSEASNLVPGDTNNTLDVFVHDRLTHTTRQVSIASDGTRANFDSIGTSLSADGRFVAFQSFSTNLVRGKTDLSWDVFIHDRLTHQTTRVSVNSTGKPGNGNNVNPRLSANGRFVAFESDAFNLVAGDTNNAYDVFVHDRLTHDTRRVSVDSNGVEGNFWSFGPSLSADGRFVAFGSEAFNLVARDTNGAWDYFIRDRKLNTDFQTDLQIAVNQKPTALAVGAAGAYEYTVTNQGPDGVGIVRLQHLISNGQVLSLTPSTGSCQRYASISLCERLNLATGSSMTVQAQIKAIRPGLRQNISVSNGGRQDPNMVNNYLTIATPVTLP